MVRIDDMMDYVKVNNMPDYAWEYRYIVAREVEGSGFWFYGAFNELHNAISVAADVDGYSFCIEEIIR